MATTIAIAIIIIATISYLLSEIKKMRKKNDELRPKRLPTDFLRNPTFF
jgi:hypothetical protein